VTFSLSQTEEAVLLKRSLGTLDRGPAAQIEELEQRLAEIGCPQRADARAAAILARIGEAHRESMRRLAKRSAAL
jgi:hypothetical protein